MSATGVKLAYLSNNAHPTPNSENGGRGICVESRLDGGGGGGGILGLGYSQSNRIKSKLGKRCLNDAFQCKHRLG